MTNMTSTRLFFATDIHGSESCFLKFLNAARTYKAKVLILGGDLTGKMVVPIVERQDGRYEANFLGRDHVLTAEKVEELEEDIQRVGYYPFRTNGEAMKDLRANWQKLEELFTRLITERIQRWIETAEKKLDGLDVEVYVSGGNDDPEYIDVLLRNSKRIIDPEAELVELHGGHEMITCVWTNPTPWKTARESSEEHIEGRLEAMVSQLRNPEGSIFNTHAPPVDSGLDLCQRLDEDLKPVFSHGQPVIFGAGSTAVRAIIGKYQPLLGLHGHIHESRGAVKIGRTLCLNPGSEYSEGILRGVVVDLNEQRVKSHIFTSG